jgi:hypothetical protein
LPHKLIESAITAYAEERHVDFDIAKIVIIANDPALRARFERLLHGDERGESQAIIVRYLQEVPDRLTASAARAENVAGLIDQTGMSVASATTVAGLVTLLTGANGLGWIFYYLEA